MVLSSNNKIENGDAIPADANPTPVVNHNGTISGSVADILKERSSLHNADHGSARDHERRASVTTFASSAGDTKRYDGVSITTGRSGRSSLSRRSRILVGYCVDDPRTVKGRRIQMTKMVCLAGIPILILIIQSGISVSQALTEQRVSNAFIAQLEFAIQTGYAVHALGLERGTTTFFVAMQEKSLFEPVMKRRLMVDAALKNMTHWPAVKDGTFEFENKQELTLRVLVNRVFVNTSTPEEQLTFFTDTIIAPLLRWVGDAVIKSESQEQRWQDLVAYYTFIIAKEGFAAERSSGTVFYARGNMTKKQYKWYLDKRSQGNAFLNKSMQFNPTIQQILVDKWYTSDLEKNVTLERVRIDENNYVPDLERGNFYYDQMSKFQSVLFDIENTLTKNITNTLNDAVSDSARTVAAQLFVVILACCLFPSIIFFLTHITGQIQTFAAVLQTKNEEIMKEKKRTDAVLNHLLPRQVAEKIKSGQPVYPESYDQVTVFFSDIVQFTDFSASSTPLQVVDTLNKLYTIMDKRIEAYDVYKVETIGDAYLCVSGLPERNGNKHSYEIACMSLDLLKDVSGIRMPHKPDYELRLRIGLNTGPCVAGITGIKMPRYCIFGDTVNTASRMESNGEPLKIHLSTATYDALTFFNIFEMERRGEMNIKGKGLMVTYWLMSKKATKRNLFGPEVKA
ncbi:uncharacterized protein LOC129602635 [Paramacrobiotus metropolitanus]|uniref:uncharacterized protein LOC129602635 n=1 Tax=Paramacrobiotus metropolitanus TaxID=2943436 RepID=UPI002445CEA0|nr:uncharacterized protein LOC129602635 [Paramacrobiotus metropolitanus]